MFETVASDHELLPNFAQFLNYNTGKTPALQQVLHGFECSAHNLITLTTKLPQMHTGTYSLVPYCIQEGVSF